MNLIIETINLNGTGRDSLIEHRTQARQALSEALTALLLTSPHPRDFPGKAQGSYTAEYFAAKKIHEERATTIHNLMEELQTEVEVLSSLRTEIL